MKNITQVVIILLLAFTFFLAGFDYGRAETADEKKEPLWELGLYNSVMVFPHYRGSDEQMYYFLALPYFIYRGKIFRSDRDGLKGIFFESDRLESNISLSGYPPVAGDTEAREGMPGLGALFGIGPELKWYLNSRQAVNPLYLATAVHGVSSLDVDSGWAMAFEGIRYSANLVYRNNTFFRKKGSFFGINAGLYYADSALNSYVYDVEQEFVRVDRPYYKSGRGHSGHSVNSYVIYGLTDTLALGFFGRWDNVSHAVYHDSPLVRQNDTFMGGISLIWKISESKKLVAVD
ncbi:MAG: MipA/OmpV family protein [Thermodesulfobacteriota bacterium]